MLAAQCTGSEARLARSGARGRRGLAYELTPFHASTQIFGPASFCHAANRRVTETVQSICLRTTEAIVIASRGNPRWIAQIWSPRRAARMRQALVYNIAAFRPGSTNRSGKTVKHCRNQSGQNFHEKDGAFCSPLRGSGVDFVNHFAPELSAFQKLSATTLGRIWAAGSVLYLSRRSRLAITQAAVITFCPLALGRSREDCPRGFVEMHQRAND